MKCTTMLDIHVKSASEVERDRILGILKTAYAEGRDEASLAATWLDAYNTGFGAGLTALKQLASFICSE